MPASPSRRWPIRSEVLLGGTLAVVALISVYVANVRPLHPQSSRDFPLGMIEWAEVIALVLAASAGAAWAGSRIVNPLAGLLLGGVGGAVASAHVWSQLGGVIGLAVGTLVVCRPLHGVCWGAARWLGPLPLGLLAGYLALRPDNDRVALTAWAAVSAAAVILTIVLAVRPRLRQRAAAALARSAPRLGLPWPAPESAGPTGVPAQIAADQPSGSGQMLIVWIPCLLAGLWLSLTADSLGRVEAVRHQSLYVKHYWVPFDAPLDARVLWQGLVRTGQITATPLTTDEAVLHFRGWPGQWGDIDFLGAKELTGRALARLQEAGHLENAYSVQLHHMPLLEDDVLACLSNSLQLFWLDASETSITGPGLRHLRHLPVQTYLTLDRSQCDDRAIEALAGARTLWDLSLAGTRVTDAGLRHLANLPNLQFVDLSDTNITPAGLKHLASAKNLRSVTLDRSFWNDRTLEAWADVPSSFWLSFHGSQDDGPASQDPDDRSQVTDEGLRHLARITLLRDLDLSRTRLTAAGLRHLQDSVNLTSINLSGTQIGGDGLRFLAGLPALVQLDLSGTDVTDAELAQVGQIASLEVLLLNDTAVTGRGLTHLAGLANLRQLHLNGSAVTDDGLQGIAGVQSLITLELNSTAVTDAGLPYLAGLAKLLSVDLPAGVTLSGVQKLRSTLGPGVSIMREDAE